MAILYSMFRIIGGLHVDRFQPFGSYRYFFDHDIIQMALRHPRSKNQSLLVGMRHKHIQNTLIIQPVIILPAKSVLRACSMCSSLLIEIFLYEINTNSYQ